MKGFLQQLFLSGVLFLTVTEIPAQTDRWNPVITSGFGDAANKGVSALHVFNGYIYAGTSRSSGTAEIWRSPSGITDTSWKKVINYSPALAPGDAAVSSIASGSGYIFASFYNTADGARCYRSSDGLNFSQFNSNGFGDAASVRITSCMGIYGSYLYAGTENMNGARLWRTPYNGSGAVWEDVLDFSAVDSSVKKISCMHVWNDTLYAGTSGKGMIYFSFTGDSGSWCGRTVSLITGDSTNTGIISFCSFAGCNYITVENNVKGGQMLRSPDMSGWQVVSADAFGKGPAVSGITAPVRAFRKLWAAGVSPASGTPLWSSSDGINFVQSNTDGFGIPANSGGTPSVAPLGNYLFSGGENASSGAQVWYTSRNILIDTATFTYAQNFNTLPSAAGVYTWRDDSLLPGWYSSRSLITAGAGTSTAGACYGFGSLSAPDRAMGSVSSSSTGDIYYGLSLYNNTPYPLTSFEISYTGEQWRCDNVLTQQISFQYRVGSTGIQGGTWISVPQLDFISPQTGAAGALDGNLPVNMTPVSPFTINTAVSSGDSFWLRWEDKNDAGFDHGLSIDDLSVKAYALISHVSWFFRSRSSGQWETASTWDVSPDGISSWTTADTVPSYLSSGIIIRYGDSVSINTSVTIDQLFVSTGGTLVYADVPGSLITVNNGPGTDVLINGTFYDSGPNSLQWNAGASWVMGNNASLVRTKGGTSCNAWRDNYGGGISNIPSSAWWISRKVDSTDPVLSTVGGMYYPNLAIENLTSAAWVTAGFSSFSGSGDYPRIKGSFEIGGSGINPVNFMNDCRNSTPVVVGGNLHIAAGSTYRNYGTGTEVLGDLIADGSVIYDSDHGRIFRLSGMSDQKIKGTSASLSFFFLEINKGSGIVDLERNIGIDSILVLSKGVLAAGSSDIIFSAAPSDAVISGGTPSSYIACEGTGLVKKYIPSAGNTYFFPVGDRDEYSPFTFMLQSGFLSSAFFTLNLRDSIHQFMPAGTGDYISRYWNIDFSGITNPVYDVSCIYADTDVSGNESAFALQKYFSGGWLQSGISNAFTNTLSGTGLTTPGSITAFTEIPLQVDFLMFEGEVVYNGVLLIWKAHPVLEKSVSCYIAEKSKDGKVFTGIGRIEGKSVPRVPEEYSFLDEDPFPGISYYRLKQVLSDGRFAYSETIPVAGWEKRPAVSVSPNPVNDDMKVRSLPGEEVMISDLAGKRLIVKNSGADGCVHISTACLASGMYFITAGGRQLKFVKE